MITGARVCLCLVLLVDCCILSPELLCPITHKFCLPKSGMSLFLTRDIRFVEKVAEGRHTITVKKSATPTNLLHIT